MAEEVILAENLTREFKISTGRGGLLGSVANLFKMQRSVKKAVDGVSFSIKEGEFAGYVGENGAGKSTTIKILTGILTPTSGRASVAGIVPYENRIENSRNIGVVFGQRTQLWWDLPVEDSFDLLRSIYHVPQADYARNFRELSETLELAPLLRTPARKLSLGQRMRCDLAASLLHNPRVLFLDEPTIGLDIIAKDQVRKFLKRINAERKTTIILTTHDMDDIEALCERIIILDEGRIAYDGSTDRLKNLYAREKLLEVEFHDYYPDIAALPGARLVKSEANRKWIRFNPDETSVQSVISSLLANYQVKDIAIHEPTVEDVVKNIYSNGMPPVRAAMGGV
ncbi:MAG: ATP-binding cassette domain-containing protein [Nitrospinae bacterium]|nr:ATP-binding cassette domain-containing protein [Nitrospinota bacterium]